MKYSAINILFVQNKWLVWIMSLFYKIFKSHASAFIPQICANCVFGKIDPTVFTFDKFQSYSATHVNPTRTAPCHVRGSRALSATYALWPSPQRAFLGQAAHLARRPADLTEFSASWGVKSESSARCDRDFRAHRVKTLVFEFFQIFN